MRKYFTIFILLLYIKNFAQQMPLADEKNIPVCCNLTDAVYEFSGLAKWKNFVLLIPQHNLINDIHHLVAIDTLSIDSVINKEVDSVRSYKIFQFDTSLNTVINVIQKNIGEHNKYGGFEAAVAIGDSLFFTIETDSLCYVIKGVIHQHKNVYTIVFKPNDTISLPKPDYRFANAGYESIAYLPSAKMLIVFYENNAAKTGYTAYTFNTKLKDKKPVIFDKPLLFRLTDVAAVKDNFGYDKLIGINHFYNDFKKDTTSRKTEFDYYITGDTTKIYTSRQLGNALAAMHGSNLLKDSYTSIVSMKITENKVYWKEEKMISYSADNWEGITPYKNGILLIVDGKPPGVTCKLSYFSLMDEKH